MAACRFFVCRFGQCTKEFGALPKMKCAALSFVLYFKREVRTMKKIRVYNKMNLAVGIIAGVGMVSRLVKMFHGEQFMDAAWAVFWCFLMLRGLWSALTPVGADSEARRAELTRRFWAEEYAGRAWMRWLPIGLMLVSAALAVIFGIRLLWLVLLLFIASPVIMLVQLAQFSGWRSQQPEEDPLAGLDDALEKTLGEMPAAENFPAEKAAAKQDSGTEKGGPEAQ